MGSGLSRSTATGTRRPTGRFADEHLCDACYRTLTPEAHERAFEHEQPELTSDQPRKAGPITSTGGPAMAGPCSPLPDRGRCRRYVRGRRRRRFKATALDGMYPGSPEQQAALARVDQRTASQFTYWPDLPTAMQDADDERPSTTPTPSRGSP
ncbi:hypothetical protein ABT010_40940 [Streptomyces sp. NPDC002668]|uniref:hypothetical protein n=1 Tax=Streptomyces sp. NPDC002668 TaxID=3154422 RepID=UPI00331E0CA8